PRPSRARAACLRRWAGPSSTRGGTPPRPPPSGRSSRPAPATTTRTSGWDWPWPGAAIPAPPPSISRWPRLCAPTCGTTPTRCRGCARRCGPAPGPPGTPVTAEPGSLLRGSPAPLSQVYDVALLDLDGVVYLGSSAVPGAPQALAKAADAGMRLGDVSNQYSRTPAAIRPHLARAPPGGDGRPAGRVRRPGPARRRGHLRAGRGDPAGRAAGPGLGRP